MWINLTKTIVISCVLLCCLLLPVLVRYRIREDWTLVGVPLPYVVIESRPENVALPFSGPLSILFFAFDILCGLLLAWGIGRWWAFREKNGPGRNSSEGL